MALTRNSQDEPICDLCGNNALSMDLWSDEQKDHDAPTDPLIDHYVCRHEEECQEAAKSWGWHFVR